MSARLLIALKAHPRKRVALVDIQKDFLRAHPEAVACPDRWERMLEELRALEAQQLILLPASGSWEKIGNPPLPKWVQVVVENTTRPVADYSEVPWLPEMGFWPELRQPALEAARTINAFLLRRRGKLRMVPIKERSLEIFGDEKRLDSLLPSGSRSLFGGRLPLATIGAFVVPAPLPYREASAPGKPVLVVENHNSYWSLGEWNRTAKRYAAVAYGSGKAFKGSGDALDHIVQLTGASGARYLGDLDPAGVRIPLEFNQSGRAETKVSPELELYAWLLANGRERKLESTPPESPSLAKEWLGEDLGTILAKLWQDGDWMPQEALGFEQLLDGVVFSTG